jgi:hypothetical protein
MRKCRICSTECTGVDSLCVNCHVLDGKFIDLKLRDRKRAKAWLASELRKILREEGGS